MARACTVCSHDERTAIDAALTHGNRGLAAMRAELDGAICAICGARGAAF